MTNMQKVQSMNADDLSFVLMCPYDTVGESDEIMPCITVGIVPAGKSCCKCIKDWLLKEAKEENNHGQ